MHFSLRRVLFSIFLNIASINVFAGVCDLSGSGIGGTGTPASMNGGSGIGGTGAPTSKSNGSGIGGTGIIANRSGIGGTGQKTDNQATVIIGTITGFGSICVNGIEIHFDRSTPVQINGETSNTEQLALGQVVAATVSGTGNEIIAQDIQVMNVVAGPIAEIDPGLNRITVLGQHVQLLEKTQFASGYAGVTNLQKGDFIQVSGLRQADGDIVASRIDQSIVKNTVHIRGTATNVTSTGFMIGGMNIDTHGSFITKEGQEVTVAGQIVAEKIVAKQVTIPTIADNQRLRLEGFVHADTGDTGNIQIKIGHVAVEATEQMKNMLVTLSLEQSVIIDGTINTKNAVEVDHLFIKDLVDKPDVQHIYQEVHKDNTDSRANNHDQHGAEQSEKNDGQKEKPEELNQIENQEIENDNDESELPETKEIEAEAVESEDSDSEKPEAEIEENKSPETESPEHEVPGIEDSETEVPEVEESELEDSEVEVPEVEAPEVEDSDVEVPEVEVPEVEVPEVEVPEVEVPEVEVPEVEVPEVEVPEVEVPEVEVPEVEVPEVEVPEVEVPEVEVPEVEVPEVEVPEVEVPEVEVPEVEVPEVEIPEVEVPDVEVPEVEVPEVEVPEVEVPEVEVPEVEVPEVEVPEVEVPEVEVPEVEIPEVEEPEIEIPEIEDNE